MPDTAVGRATNSMASHSKLSGPCFPDEAYSIPSCQLVNMLTRVECAEYQFEQWQIVQVRGFSIQAGLLTSASFKLRTNSLTSLWHLITSASSVVLSAKNPRSFSTAGP